MLYKGLTYFTSITLSVTGLISRKLLADIFITGNIIMAVNIQRLYVQLIDAELYL